MRSHRQPVHEQVYRVLRGSPITPFEVGEGGSSITGALPSGTCSMAGALFRPLVTGGGVLAGSVDPRVAFTEAATCS